MKVATDEPLLGESNTESFRDSKCLPLINYTSPDQLLNYFGISNLYLLWIWLSMSVVWALSAMPMMVSAFIMDDICVPSDVKNCTPVNGTISNEFNLTGSSAYLVDYSTTSFMLGITIGSTFLAVLSDRKGRRMVLLICLSMLGAFGTLSAFATNIYVFIVLRFFQGLFFTGVGITNWVLAYECIPLKLRSYTTTVFGLFWVLGYCACAPIAYYLPLWRHLILAVSLPSIIFSFIYYFTIPESFHYLVSQSNTKEVEKWISRANHFAIFSNSPRANVDSESFCKTVAEHNSSKRQIGSEHGYRSHLYILFVLVYCISLLQISFFCFTLPTCDTFVYYGLSLFSTQLAGNRYANFALMGLIEIPSYVCSPFFLDRLGRRWFVSICHFLAAISFVVIVFSSNPWLNLSMWLVGKFAIASAFTCLFVYASEVFPTSRFNILAPTIFFGFVACLGGALTLLLPETLNKELPDTVEQMGMLISKKEETSRKK